MLLQPLFWVAPERGVPKESHISVNSRKRLYVPGKTFNLLLQFHANSASLSHA